jgi:hypothetical protein
MRYETGELAGLGSGEEARGRKRKGKRQTKEIIAS